MQTIDFQLLSLLLHEMMWNSGI